MFQQNHNLAQKVPASMKPWTIDASSILSGTPPEDGLHVVMTRPIKAFLNEDRHRILVASKGFGKTLILIAKRLQYHLPSRAGFQLIPGQGLLVDLPPGGAGDLNMSNKSLAYFRDFHTWAALWRVCISLSIFRSVLLHSSDANAAQMLGCLAPSKDNVPTALPISYALLHGMNGLLQTPLSFLDHILRETSHAEVRQLIREQSHIDLLIPALHTPVAVFIDNIDEYLEEHLEKSEAHDSSARGKFDIELWYAAQIGLIYAIETLSKKNHHLNIYATVRNEAYERLGSSTTENIRGICLSQLSYSHLKLREIFGANVALMDEQDLCLPLELANDPGAAFLGFAALENARTHDTEDVFDYIYRHTLKRPRDIVRMGLELSMLEPAERDPSSVRNLVNITASSIAKDYINALLPHTGFSTFDDVSHLLKRIRRNILELKSLRRICSAMNTTHCKAPCNDCRAHHVFCDLYKLGLLGVIRENKLDGTTVQYFTYPGEVPLEKQAILPDSPFFLIHPTLNDMLGGEAPSVADAITIGDGRPWRNPTLFERQYTIFLSYAEEDLEFMSKLRIDLEKLGITCWYDRKNVSAGDPLFEEIVDGIASCDVFLAIVSKRALASAWVSQEIQASCTVESKLTGHKVVPVLLDDAWDETPEELRMHHYADFRSSYDSGLADVIAAIVKPPPRYLSSHPPLGDS